MASSGFHSMSSHLDVGARHVFQFPDDALRLTINWHLCQPCMSHPLTMKLRLGKHRKAAKPEGEQVQGNPPAFCITRRYWYKVPGISTRVRLGTLGEYTVNWIGSGATARPFPLR